MIVTSVHANLSFCTAKHFSPDFSTCLTFIYLLLNSKSLQNLVASNSDLFFLMISDWLGGSAGVTWWDLLPRCLDSMRSGHSLACLTSSYPGSILIGGWLPGELNRSYQAFENTITTAVSGSSIFCQKKWQGHGDGR